ncbi:MAG TPA: hypothetical protein VFX98_07045, partial [Longimicrobiaceae bacterium]|nr:hypothetical protein [Longimicrobiaceae bacterium]
RTLHVPEERMSDRREEMRRLLEEMKVDLAQQEELRRQTDDALARMHQALERARAAPPRRRSWFAKWFGNGSETPAEGLYRLRRDERTGGFTLEPVDLST